MHATAAAGFGFMMILMGMLTGGSIDKRAAPAAESKRAFEAVMQHVEPGGDLLLVLNTENFVKGAAGTLCSFVETATQGKQDREAVIARRVAAALPEFLKRNGFLALQAVGASSVPDGGDVHRSRAFALREAAAETSPLWRGLVGGAPRALASHSYWTEDVAWAASGTGEASELWKILRAIINELVPEARPEFERGLAELGAKLGLDVEALVASLGDEAFVALTLDDASSFTVPDLNVPMPTPGLLIGVRLKQPLLADRLDVLLKQIEANMPLMRTTVGDTTLTSVPVPVPAPFPVQVTMAYRKADGMLLVGSSTEVVRRAVEAATSGQKQLLNSSAFAAEFGGKAPVNNGIQYIGKRFGVSLGKLQQAVLDKAAREERDAGGAALIRQLQEVLTRDAFSVTVVVNSPEGVALLTRGTAGPERYISSGLVAPTAMLAAIAIPNFLKARETSQRHACVNQLRMIDGAKEQWALANNKAQGAQPTEADVAEYIKGGMPRCTQTGAAYRINPIGVDPVCASGLPDHKLP